MLRSQHCKLDNTTSSNQDYTAFGFNKSNIQQLCIPDSYQTFSISAFLSNRTQLATISALVSFYSGIYIQSQCIQSNIVNSPVHIPGGSTKFHPLQLLSHNPSSWSGIKATFRQLSQFFSTLVPGKTQIVSCDLVFFDKYYKVCHDTMNSFF